ncbi:MAG: lipoate--protein ligase family protein [bacterium]|nr:lipoate--protein ligase family protein [bacterium]
MELRVVDAGTVGPFRSQALWHGIASAMKPGDATVLSFCRPSSPYVGLGYHRSIDEIDLGACDRLGLPVIRRQIGGGPVYLDADQLFFQVTLPADRAPARIDLLYEMCLEPAASAFRALGLAVRRNGVNDLAVADERGNRKISGTGAGRIDDGVTVVGNVLFRFPHERMVEVLALAGDRSRQECLRLMRRHVTSLAAEGFEGVGFDEARSALIEAYGEALGTCLESALNESEEEAISEWEERLGDPEWLAVPERPRRTMHHVKISADAWLVMMAEDGLSVEASIVGGQIERARIVAPGLDANALEGKLAGQSVRSAELRRTLEPFGVTGRRVVRLFETLPTLA